MNSLVIKTALVRRRPGGISKSNPTKRLKNRIRYRKNRFKIKMYNRKYRSKHKMQIKRRNKIRRQRKSGM